MEGNTLINFIFPARCPVCDNPVRPFGALICTQCEKKLIPVSGPVCLKCGSPVYDKEAELCRGCRENKKPFIRNISAFEYNSPMKKSMEGFKFYGRREYAAFYARALMSLKGEEIRAFGATVIIPVPVHESRLKKRGYNQAAEIGKHLSKKLGIPMEAGTLIRFKQTEAQKDLDFNSRIRNLAQAMRVKRRFSPDETVLLVDDIYTTGSTLSSCTQALKSAGAARVFSVTVCTGKDY